MKTQRVEVVIKHQNEFAESQRHTRSLFFILYKHINRGAYDKALEVMDILISKSISKSYILELLVDRIENPDKRHDFLAYWKAPYCILDLSSVKIPPPIKLGPHRPKYWRSMIELVSELPKSPLTAKKGLINLFKYHTRSLKIPSTHFPIHAVSTLSDTEFKMLFPSEIRGTNA